MTSLAEQAMKDAVERMIDDELKQHPDWSRLQAYGAVTAAIEREKQRARDIETIARYGSGPEPYKYDDGPTVYKRKLDNSR
jgi:hypothetical protein